MSGSRAPLDVPSRARERRGGIFRDMAAQRWERGQAAELATRDGISTELVEREAAIISDVLEECGGDVEAVRVEIAAGLRRVEAEAEELRQAALEHGGETGPAYSAAVSALGVKVKALDTRARHRGLGVAKQETNVQVNLGAASEDEFYRRMVRVLERPDRVTLRALEAAGWRRDVVDTKGEEVSE